jgi:hypothetical protein
MPPYSSHGSVSTLLSAARSSDQVASNLADAEVVREAIDAETHRVR